MAAKCSGNLQASLWHSVSKAGQRLAQSPLSSPLLVNPPLSAPAIWAAPTHLECCVGGVCLLLVSGGPVRDARSSPAAIPPGLETTQPLLQPAKLESIDTNNNSKADGNTSDKAVSFFCGPSSTSDYYSSGSEEFLSPAVLLDIGVASESISRKSSLAEQRELLNRMSSVTTDPTSRRPQVYKLVLTGGPCGGKTTGQDRLATFFENMGWKVFTVPETATVLLRGGVKFSELNPAQVYQFQKDLLLTLLQIEKVFFNQAELIQDRNVLIICDRGAMDPSAYLDSEGWQRIMKDCNLNCFDLRENRYNQVVHMVTAADGADDYYTLKNNNARYEGIKEAIDQDSTTRNAWVGHPYVDIVDNKSCSNFNDKILQLIQVVCDRVGLHVQDRLSKNSKKRKWLVKGFDDSQFPKYEEFSVRHDYLSVPNPDIQARIRQRCQNGRSTYTLTTRQLVSPGKVGGEQIETRRQLNLREYNGYLKMRDKTRVTLYKKRRCFTYGTQYFNFDSYVDPLPPACHGDHLMMLETYTTIPAGDPEFTLPPFLNVEREITGDLKYSMYMLAEASPLVNGVEQS
ncbi:AAA domain-containing protein [Ditylenchus destructor]|nr:AAA domain-containing protein [Ditylenchus destructor]